VDSSHCSDLIEAIALRRDKGSFRQLFDHFAPRLKHYAMKTGCREHEAEDLAQDALISVWRNAASFDRRKANGVTWLFTVIRNKRIDMVRRTRHAHVLYDESEDDRAAEADDPETSLQQTQLGQLMRDALQHLSREQREILELAFFGSKTHQEVADDLSIPLGTVKSRIRLALARLRNATDIMRAAGA
jgi:RNA polymerase sigma-70 factor (ECF subfamily)